MIYKPNLPSVRALFRAIKSRDLAGAASALESGAPAEARTGSGAMGEATCSALMKALEGQDGGSAALLLLLLDHGANLFKRHGGPGRFPLEELMRRDHPGLTAAVVERWGGVPAFARDLRDAGHAYMALRALAVGSLSGDPVKAHLFFELWDTCPNEVAQLRSRPIYSGQTKEIWPWHGLVGKALPLSVRRDLGRRAALPTPEELGADAWMLWMEALAEHGKRQGSALFRELLKATPADWWLGRRMPVKNQCEDASGKPGQCRQTLLEALLLKGSAAAMEVFLQSCPCPDEIRGHASRLWRAVGSAGATGAATVLKTVCPPESAGGQVLGQALCEALRRDYDPHHRARLVHLLLDAGARADVVGELGATPLHWLVRWRKKDDRHASLVHRLLAAGANWDRPIDHMGRSPAHVFREVDPKGWAKWQAEMLDQNLTVRSRGSTPKMRL